MILLITYSGDDPSVDVVLDALTRSGADAVRIDTDLFPSRVSLAAWHDHSGPRGRLIANGRVIDLDDVTAVWHRRWRTAGAMATHLSGEVLEATQLESRMSLEGAIQSLDCFHLDDAQAVARTRNRVLQLELARAAGLETPRSLTTNDPAAVRDFFDACGGAMVVKMLSSFSVADRKGREQVVMTNDFTRAMLERIESVAMCPMTFQEKLDKKLELRITIAGHEVFAAAVDSSRSASGGTDWRRANDEFSDQWKAYELPPFLRDRLVALLDELRMNYGAIDVIVTPDDRFVFLEVNPVGQFGWIEESTGQPIAAALAGLLTGQTPRRVEVRPLRHDR
jgi:glutathione synthase/RimK-type ligase-like ATP-grasp enzyme